MKDTHVALMNNSTPSPHSRPGKPQIVKAVLFDLDDTLWPIAPVIARAEQILFEWLQANAEAVTRRFSIDSLRQQRLQLAATDPVFRFDLWKLRHAALSAALSSVGDDPAKADAAMAVFSEARHAVTPFADVQPALSRLQRRLPLGTVSNGFADLGKIGLAGHFQASIAAHSFGSGKPDPAIFHAACAALKVAPQEALYVGDDPLLDVVGAQQAGLQAVWINRFERSLPDGVQPQASCTSLDELEAWLEQTRFAG